MTVSLIIPTYKRSVDLSRLLNSLSSQTIFADEVVVVIGPDDFESVSIVEVEKRKLQKLRMVISEKASVVHAINLGLRNSLGDIICLTDDDVWLPVNWLEKIMKAFKNDPKMGAYGGRDHLQLHNQPALSSPDPAYIIGRYQWDGQLIGNHHCGSVSSPIEVDVLKGCNLSFRRSAFPGMKIEPCLEFMGAETCWEIDICQQIIKAGHTVVYDNNNYVYHFAAQRQNYDNRGDLFSPSWPRRIYNEALMTAKFRPLRELVLFWLRSVCIGTRFQPGLIWSVLLIPKHSLSVMRLPLRYAMAAKRGALTGIRLRRSQHI